jgi:protein-disulfide isomerase
VSDASKKARRDQAREHARQMREIERKRKARNGWIIKGGVVVVLIAAAVAIVLVVTSLNNAAIEAAKPKPGPANMISDGIILTGDSAGSGEIVAVPTAAIPADGEPTPTDPADYANQVRIVTYIDYFCPICKAFEEANAQQLGTWVSAGAATLEVHPISILDRSSLGTRYATRAANAMACVANFQPDLFFQATTAMYAEQPAEGTKGLDNDEIIAVLTNAGVTDPKVATCVNAETFSQWVTKATQRTNGPIPNSTLAGVTGTPTVLVNGIQYTGAVDDAAAFSAFVTAIATTGQPPTE